jgi:4-alpha-glucanotransferase
VIRRHQENPDAVPAWQAHGAHNTLRILSEFAGIPIPSHAPWPPLTEGIRLRLIKSLLTSNSRYALLMVTELFDIDTRINEPGTRGGNNWRFRVPWTIRQIREDGRLREISRKFAAAISLTRRAP